MPVGKTISFRIAVDFASKHLMSGQPSIEMGTGDFGVTLTKENGKFVIVDANNQS